MTVRLPVIFICKILCAFSKPPSKQKYNRGYSSTVFVSSSGNNRYEHQESEFLRSVFKGRRILLVTAKNQKLYLVFQLATAHSKHNGKRKPCSLTTGSYFQQSVLSPHSSSVDRSCFTPLSLTNNSLFTHSTATKAFCCSSFCESLNRQFSSMHINSDLSELTRK